jgi:N-6 DNA Methylase
MKRNFATIDSGETKTIHEFIERHLEPNEREKKLFGEVFTPLPLVQEMLGSIEKYADKDFWKNPNLKILDPAAGIGNFPLIAYEKLMEGLKSVKGFKGEGEKEVEARRKHILEKMLYMVELNPNNVRLMNKIFNGKKYTLNVLCTDFLLETEADIKKHDGLSSRQKADGKRLLEWKTMKFDLVMGNPPFNDEGGVAKGGNNLYQHFVDVGLNMINKKGNMAMITPAGIMKTTTFTEKTPILEKINEMCILHININECKKHFHGIGSNFIYFLIENRKCDIIKSSVSKVGSMEFRDENINIKELNWIPIIANNVCISIIKKCSFGNFNFQRSSNISSNLKCLVLMKRLNHINYKNPDMFPFVDNQTGTIYSDNVIYKEVSNLAHGEFVCKIISSKIYKFINIVSRFDAVIYHNLFNQFGIPKVSQVPKTVTDDYIFKIYKLTQAEKKLIESLV